MTSDDYPYWDREDDYYYQYFDADEQYYMELLMELRSIYREYLQDKEYGRDRIYYTNTDWESGV